MADDLPPGFRIVHRPPASPVGPFPGMLQPGNIDLGHRPIAQNPDGSYSTVRSMSFGDDGGKEILVPTVSPDGTILSDDAAIDAYGKTGQTLGVFDTPEHADMYAGALHKAQEQFYGAQSAAAPVDDVPPGFKIVAPETAQPATRSAEDVQAEFDAQPWYAKAGTAADDVMRAIANGATFGFADKLAGYMNGTGTEAERQKSAEAAARGGSASTVAEIGGSIATPIAAAGKGATLIGRFGTDALKGAGGLLARSGLAAAEGAGYGALSAAGQDHDISDGALLGAIMGGAASPLVEGVQAVVGGALRGTSRPVMTIDQARDAGQRAYQAADVAGVAFTPQAIDKVRNNVTGQLADFGYDPALQPGAAAVLKRLDELGGQNVTLKGLETLRKVASNGYVQGNNSNNRVIDMLIGAIDDAVDSPAAGDVLMGDANAGATALKEARDMWRRASRGAQVQGALTDAEFQTARAGFGGNTDNPIRQRLDSIRKSGARGFSPDEREALETAIKGSPLQNFYRRIGAFSPERAFGTVSTPMSIVGAGPLGALVPAAGWAANRAAGAIGHQNVDELMNVIMNGGARPPQNAAQRAVSGAYDPLIRAIIGAVESPDEQPVPARRQ